MHIETLDYEHLCMTSTFNQIFMQNIYTLLKLITWYNKLQWQIQGDSKPQSPQ